MDYQYKIIVSNRTVYKEFEIAAGVENVRLGTTSSCEFRLNPETFFSEIEIEFSVHSNKWNMDCADHMELSHRKIRRPLPESHIPHPLIHAGIFCPV